MCPKNLKTFVDSTLQVIKGGKVISEYDGNRTEKEVKEYIGTFE